jgi:hypothetical protein
MFNIIEWFKNMDFFLHGHTFNKTKDYICLVKHTELMQTETGIKVYEFCAIQVIAINMFNSNEPT